MSAGLVTAALTPERLAGLPELHKSPGRQRLDEQHPCVELAGACGQLPARAFLRGRLCTEHQPALPDPAASLPAPSQPRTMRVYGTATTDPLGRDGLPINKQTRLPQRPA